MRGENDSGKEKCLFFTGSPPHAWGKFVQFLCLLIPCRFTPTCVGKIPAVVSDLSGSPVHPHMRGENSMDGNLRMSLNGSPPHAWGKLLLIRRLRQHHRFTPTCVGKICVKEHTYLPLSVHPHMRGENHFQAARHQVKFGSPPHAWGKCRSQCCAFCPRRFTPTCVGKMLPTS